ncbi:MAG: hypothetical protein HYX77_04095 [Acidobacteria bacterium]|nr:hypothetical protein [Acidobacteriota bacterium]
MASRRATDSSEGLTSTDYDIVPQPADHRLLVRLHALANPRRNEALARLCDTLNVLKVCYPGTDLTLVYQAPVVA